jgi:malate dehydrogenase
MRHVCGFFFRSLTATRRPTTGALTPPPSSPPPPPSLSHQHSTGVYDPARLLGVTTLDVVRAETFIAEIAGCDPRDVHVPVVGGHAGATILPLLSQSRPAVLPALQQHHGDAAPAKLLALTRRIQDAGTEVVEAKAGAGSATLSMAWAAARFTDACLRAMSGEQGVVECCYVQSRLTSLPFFASPVRLGKKGVEEFLPLGALSEAEQKGYDAMLAELGGSIDKGVAFAAKWRAGGGK